MHRVIMDWPAGLMLTEMAGTPLSWRRQDSRALERRFPRMVQKSTSGMENDLGRQMLAVTWTECSLAV